MFCGCGIGFYWPTKGGCQIENTGSPTTDADPPSMAVSLTDRQGRKLERLLNLCIYKRPKTKASDQGVDKKKEMQSEGTDEISHIEKEVTI
jgi:hypothetical protein